MHHISLFSGIGGFDLAADQTGWENIASCEINPFAQKVLKYYWPNAYHHDDIKTFTYEKLNEELTKKYGLWRTKDIVLTGGFPCQPYSLAGKRKGTEDERHLWPEMLRAIREIQPTYVVGENVFGIINWDGGMVFNQVHADLEAEGYEVFAYVLPACAVDAPHRRDRVWFVAKNTNSNGRNGIEREKESGIGQFGNFSTGNNERICPDHEEINATDTESWGQRGLRNESETTRTREINHPLGSICGIYDATNSDSGRQSRKEYRKEESRQLAKESFPNNWENFPTESPIRRGNDGIPERLVGITFPKWRNESIKAYGNAIVPQVALQIFKAIDAIHISQKAAEESK